MPRFDCVVVVTQLLGPDDGSHARSAGVALETAAAEAAGVPVACVRAGSDGARMLETLDRVFQAAWRRGGMRPAPATFLAAAGAPG